MRAIRPLVGAAALVLLLAGCSAPPTDAAPGATRSVPAASGPQLSGELTIYAAASLSAAFDELAKKFETQNPGVTVKPISYDGSSTLATQLVEGAPADVFASADEKNMAKVAAAGLAGGAVPFATNTLTLVVPAGNPGHVTALKDLANPALNVVLCAAEVPCGAASKTLLKAQGITASVDSYEQNVTAVLTKVAAGEADAGLIYVTDAKGNDTVTALATPGAADVVNTYPIAALKASHNPAVAAAFVAFVTGSAGRTVLAGLGFGAP